MENTPVSSNYEFTPALKASLLEFIISVYDIGQVTSLLSEDRNAFTLEETNLITSCLGKFPAHLVYNYFETMRTEVKPV